MRETKGFSYDPEKDKDVIRHIDSQPNRSQYIWALVRKDMKGSDIVEVINRQIEKYLGNIAYTKPVAVKDSMDIGIDTNDIQSILNL